MNCDIITVHQISDVCKSFCYGLSEFQFLKDIISIYAKSEKHEISKICFNNTCKE